MYYLWDISKALKHEKVNMNNLDSSGILGLVEAVEFKKRFTSIKVKSKMASLKRIKAFDFFKVLVSNPKDARNDELMLNYICEKKKTLIRKSLSPTENHTIKDF